MKLQHGLHLAYCTNIHRGEDWAQTFETLQRHTLAVRQQVCPDRPYAIGLRLSHQAAHELNEPATLKSFRRWLDQNQCYVFTINGFPYGAFHGTRVKELVYRPDWTTGERVEYTNVLFDLLVQLLPEGVDGSVSTVPGSFKEFVTNHAQVQQMRKNIWRTVEHVARLSEQSGRDLHLGLEPEPLCYLETSLETAEFFDRMRDDYPNEERLDWHLGVNYDACHLAVEFEQPAAVLDRFRQHRIKVSKLHLSSALKVHPTPDVRQALATFDDQVYLHQVIEHGPSGALTRYRDLDLALQRSMQSPTDPTVEWRIHFHIPLHSQPSQLFNNTTTHLLELLNLLRAQPDLCHHLEMETYTWEVLPPELKKRDVVDQLVAEYRWTLHHLQNLGLA